MYKEKGIIIKKSNKPVKGSNTTFGQDDNRRRLVTGDVNSLAEMADKNVKKRNRRGKSDNEGANQLFTDLPPAILQTAECAAVIDAETARAVEKLKPYRMFPLASADFPIENDGYIRNLLQGIAVGNVHNQFEGDTILPKWIKVNYTVTWDNSSIAVGDCIKFTFVVFQCLGGPDLMPNPAALWQAVGSVTSGGTEPLKDINWNLRTSINVLFHRPVTLSGPTQKNSFESREVFIKGEQLKPVRMTDAAALVNGGLYWFAISDRATGDPPIPVVTVYSNVKYACQ